MSEELKDARGAPKGSFGNVPYDPEPNREMVRKLSGLQISQAEVAMVIGVSPDTIQRHHADDFAYGKAMKGIKLREHAYDLAFGVLNDPDDATKGYKPGFQPSERMTQFMLERQFGMVQQTRQEHVGDPDRPVEISHIRRMVVDPKAAPDA